MKIFKQKEHSLLVKPFGVRDTLYLAATVLIFFDLENPDEPLTEQDLWSAVPQQLGSQGVLDMGMAKTRGEVLVTGSCHAPRGTTRNAAQVSVRVGAVEKQLHVFGDRQWTSTGGVARVISDPRPFSEMPITYENAFGGEGFSDNPLGKGVAPVIGPDGETGHHPLPNIETPEHLIGSPADRPDPAGFGPLDLLWPQRARKQGTYDQRWQQERWPHFPDDMDYEFFNAAPADQFITGFFAEGEPVDIVNMHPDIQQIQSHLPRLRIRCFATKKTTLQTGATQDEVFEEIPLHIDTVHLFPSILRGVVMYRGTTRILDDEYADVRRILVATEQLDEAPQSLEFYLDAQTKALDRTVAVDRTPLEAAQKKIGAAIKRINALPKEIHDVKLRAMGKAPQMPTPTTAEIKQRSESLLAGHAVLLDKLEARAKGMHAKWGHLAEIPLHKFAAIRSTLDSAGQRVDQAQKEIAAAIEKGAAVKKSVADQLKSNVKPDDLAKAGIDPDNLLAPPSVNPWHDNGFPFVVRCRKALEYDRDTMSVLSRLGFHPRTIRRAWLGIHQGDPRYEDRAAWGLAPRQDARGKTEPLVLPPGLVMPRFDGPVLNRMLIGSLNEDGAAHEILVEGSDESPLFLPAATLIDLPGAATDGSAPCIRTADELQALLVAQEVGDACSVITLARPDEKPDAPAAEALANAAVLLVLLPETGIDDNAWAAWRQAFPNAEKLVLPRGNTVFEAYRHGVDIHGLVMAALPHDVALRHQVEPVLPEPGKAPKGSPSGGLPIPSLNIGAMVRGLTQEIRAVHQPKFDTLLEEQKKAIESARQALLKVGQSPDDVFDAGRLSQMSLSQTGDAIAEQLNRQRDALGRAGRLTPELETQLNTQAANAARMGRDAEQRLQEGKARIADAQRKAEALKGGQIPEDFKARLSARGLDPEKLKKLTREQVVERHARKESLSQAVLNGVDLSGLDLQGIDLRKAQCRGTHFCGTNLTGADLSQILAQEADFSEACLHGCHSQKGIFPKAIFKRADLSEADLRMAVFKGADLSEADFSHSKLHMTIMEKAKLEKARFVEASVSMSVFTAAQAPEADFSNARLTKCIFQKACLDRADFSGAVLKATMFYGTTGVSIMFTGADMSKSRMGGGTVFSGADFTGIRMKQGCFKDADLSGADFQGARIDSAMLENCDLKGANFFKVSTVKTRFSKSNLGNANMRGVNLFLGSLRKARLVNTDLRDSNLYAVDLYKAVFGETRLDGANLKKTLLQGRTEYLS